MKRIATTISALFAFAVGADVAASAVVPDYSLPLDALRVFIGSSDCTGRVHAMGAEPARATTGKSHGAWTLGGHWIVLRYDEDASTTNVRPYRVAQYLGYDPAKKRFLAVALDNSVSSFASGSSSGWKDDAIVIDSRSTGGGKAVTFRDIYTHKGTGEFHHVGKVRDAHGAWLTIDEETCTKF